MWAIRNWKLIAGAVLVLLFIGGILSYGHRQYARGVADAKADAAAEIERYKEHQREIDEEVQREHQAQIDEVERRANRLMRGPAIRLCQPSGGMRADTAESAGSPGDGHALQAGPDIRGELVQFGKDARKLQQQLNAIKQRQEALRER